MTVQPGFFLPLLTHTSLLSEAECLDTILAEWFQCNVHPQILPQSRHSMDRIEPNMKYGLHLHLLEAIAGHRGVYPGNRFEDIPLEGQRL